MEKRTAIAWCVLGGLVLLAGWWGLVPKIGTATEAEVRAHVAPELLQPLPHPAGGVARFDALQQAVGKFPEQSRRRSTASVKLDLDNPIVTGVIDILREGPIERTQDIPVQSEPFGWQYGFDSELDASLLRLANSLTDTASRAAKKGDWTRVRQHMEASCLLLDRLLESDVRVHDRRWTMVIESKVYQTALALAARRDMPAALAERLSTLLVKDRHDSANLLRVLQGEMQLLLLGRIGVRPVSYYAAGTYDPLETAELISSRFLRMARDAGLPTASRSSAAFNQELARRSQLTGDGWYWSRQRGFPYSVPYLMWPVERIRLNTSDNSIGLTDAAAYPDGNLMDGILLRRTQQDHVAAALALVRFRQGAAREPRDFDELVATGLLRAVPMDHRQEQPMSFNQLKGLLERSAPRK